MSKRKTRFHCKSEAQKKAIKASYARKAAENKTPSSIKTTDKFPTEFPFWARFKPNKGRTTLVIDEEQVKRTNSEKVDDYFVHREAIHCTEDNRYVLSGDYEKIFPNPDSSDSEPMYLKRPHKHPKGVFEPHNKNLAMPEYLRQRYDKNNHKAKSSDGGDGDKRT